MLNVESLIIHLQKKITEYRYHQKRTQKARTDIRQAHSVLLSLKNTLKTELGHAFDIYRTDMERQVMTMVQFMCHFVEKVRRERDEEVLSLRGQIERQHNVISEMKKAVLDLDQLISLQSSVIAQRERERQEQMQSKEEGQNREEGKGNNVRDGEGKVPLDETSPPRTFGGLQVIQQETERTLLSSARSGQDQRCLTDNFIRIEQQQDYNDPSQSYTSSYFLKQPQQFKLSSCDRPQHTPSSSQISPSESLSNDHTALSKLEQMMELSHFSQRVHSLGQESFPQYQSLPISLGQYPRGQAQCLTWAASALKDISNQSDQEGQRERQSKSKMFLQEFRRTFNKCLSSSGTSRKNSAKLDHGTRPAKSNRQGQQSHIIPCIPHQQVPMGSSINKQSQRLISQMLQNMDNNNKFFVGSRKIELRYQGGRKGGAREGQGVLYYSNGFSYQGEFRNNLRHGYGVLRYNQTEIYRGEWQADELSGQGKIRNATAVNRKKTQGNTNPSCPLLRWVSYCGYFRSNRFEGEGTLYLQGGEKFLGRFICGSACGQGTLYRKNGQVETGIWRNNQLVESF